MKQIHIEKIKMEQLTDPPLFLLPSERPDLLSKGEYTPSKARTPVAVDTYQFALTLSMDKIDLLEIIRRIQQFVNHNHLNLVKYVEYGKNQSEYVMQKEMLYKTHLILHDEMDKMTFIHIEVFLSHSKNAYLVEIKRMRGRNPAYGYFYRGLRDCIRTGELDPVTIYEHLIEEQASVQRMLETLKIPLYTNETNGSMSSCFHPI
jgi:uncharacterized protein YciU (UPF0263 family)